MNLYYCRHCNRRVMRQSDKAWINSFCEFKGQQVRLMRVMPDKKLSIRRCELVSCKGGIDGCNSSNCKNARWDKMTPQQYRRYLGGA